MAGGVLRVHHWYDLEHAEVNFYQHQLMNKIIPTGAVRTVGNYFSVFAIESFMDEIAHELDIDPLDLRLSLLKGVGRNAGAII